MKIMGCYLFSCSEKDLSLLLSLRTYIKIEIKCKMAFKLLLGNLLCQHVAIHTLTKMWGSSMKPYFLWWNT